MRTILALSLTMTCTLTAYSQQTRTSSRTQGSSNSSLSATQAGRSIDIQSGTRLAAELQNTVDVRRAKVGDQVILKTTKAIKSEGRTVVDKGARLIGHVTEVEQKTKANGASRIGIVFDRLENGSLEVPISATISSITRGSADARVSDDDLFSTNASASSTTSTRSTSTAPGGGVLGGVANTAGGVVNTTGNVVGSTTSSVGATVDSTTAVAGGNASGLGRSLGRIQVSESSSTTADGGALLTLRGEDLRLEKGTRFNLVVNQSASMSTSKDQ
ncbi:MAG: hypothetical protein ACREBG_00015 [Pyrinomonadaceae bacterium]